MKFFMHTPFKNFGLPVLMFLGPRICFGLSMQMVAVALGWHIYEITGEAFKLALVGLVFVLCMFVFLFLTGFVIDLFRRRDILETDADGLGLLRAMPALGSVIVGFTLARMGPIRRAGRKLFLVLVVFSFSIFAFALSEILWLSFLALVVYGAVDMVSVNIRVSMVQLGTPDDLRGCVNAVSSLCTSSSNHLGTLRAGWLASVIGPLPTAVLGGCIGLAVSVWGWFTFKEIRKIDGVENIEALRGT